MTASAASFYQIFCPICKQPVAWKDNPFRPFCSERCKTRDLGAWATESYRVPGEWVEDVDLIDERDRTTSSSEED